MEKSRSGYSVKTSRRRKDVNDAGTFDHCYSSEFDISVSFIHTRLSTQRLNIASSATILSCMLIRCKYESGSMYFEERESDWVERQAT